MVWLLIGLLAGALAGFLVPGSDQMGVPGTVVLGIVGGLVGGFLGNVVTDGQFDVNTAGVIGAAIGATVALVIYRSATERTT